MVKNSAMVPKKKQGMDVIRTKLTKKNARKTRPLPGSDAIPVDWTSQAGPRKNGVGRGKNRPGEQDWI